MDSWHHPGHGNWLLIKFFYSPWQLIWGWFSDNHGVTPCIIIFPKYTVWLAYILCTFFCCSTQISLFSQKSQCNKIFIYRFSAWRKWSWKNTKRQTIVDLKETKKNSNICIRSWHISRSWFTILIRVVPKSYQLTTKGSSIFWPLASLKIFFELYIFLLLLRCK